jgi:5-keto 4-deoxyuronate isomerase
MDFRYAEAKERPLDEDNKSCPFGAYIRKDIQEVEYEDMEGNTQHKFTYQEAFVSHEEYNAYTATKYAVEQSQQPVVNEEEVQDRTIAQLIEDGVI